MTRVFMWAMDLVQENMGKSFVKISMDVETPTLLFKGVLVWDTSFLK